MVLTFGIIWLVLVPVLSIAIGFLTKSVKQGLKSILYTWLLAVGIVLVIDWISSSITIIHKDRSHDSYMVFGTPSFSLDGEEYTLTDLSLFSSYLVNETSDDLILYPIVYGKGGPDFSEKDVCFINAGNYNEIRNTPDYYFESPEQINVREHWLISIFKSIFNMDYEVKWILEKYDGE